MYYDHEEERDPFDLFGEPEPANESVENDTYITEDLNTATAEPAPAVIEPKEPVKVKTGFSWAGFAGGLAALVWIAGAIGGPLTYFGVERVMAMDPALQVGILALAFGPALLFWVSASAAGEALKARRLAVELTRIAHEAKTPFEASQADAQRLTHTVKNEIESLNDAVAAAMNRLAELEQAAQRNAALFGDVVSASRENTAALSEALRSEREALAALNGDLSSQTDTIANSIGRQVRLMREASKLVKTEITSAEESLENHLASFTATATVMGERTVAFHQAADNASAAAHSLNGSMSEMLDGLSEATRLTETAKKSTEQAVLAANETASAVRETTRSAVFEAKRAAQLIRAESQAMQEAANDTLAKLQDAANAARAASEESQAAADRHAASIEKRLGALAAVAGAKKTAAPRPVERKPEPVVVANEVEEVSSLHAAASAAVSRGRGRVETRTEAAPQPRGVFKGFGSWGNFMPSRETPPVAANEAADDLVHFEPKAPVRNADADLKRNTLDLVATAGVDIEDVLQAADLERIARASRDGAGARRNAVIDSAPGAVMRISRLIKRDERLQTLARQFRARPDLAKSDSKGEGSELVRAYLLIDAALA